MDEQRKTILLVLVALCIQQSIQQKKPHYVRNRTTMVHLFEWTFDDIARECEQFLGPYGYGGLQTSVITECVVIRNNEVKRPWWERYQAMSYKFISRSGNEQQFGNMVRRCNNAGVRVYVDIVLNHMTGNTGDYAIGTGGSTANPGAKDYPVVPYDSSHFHKTCAITNWDDAYQIRNCELLKLRDLDQSKYYVREKLIDKLNRMVDAGVAGFRVDAAKHMLPSDLEYIYNSVKNLRLDHGFPENARAFIIQEVFDFGLGPIRREEYIPIGTVTEFRFGIELTKHFGGSNEIQHLKSFGTSWGLMKGEDCLAFVDNHDTQRDGTDVLNYKKAKEYKMAIAFMLAHPQSKIPRVMSSFAFDNKEQGPPMDSNENIISPIIYDDNTCGNGWVCEHRWRPIYGMVKFKNVVGDAPLTNWWDNGSNQIAFCRGNRGFIAINKSGNLKRTLQTCLPSGKYCDVITGDLIDNKCTGKIVTVDGNGNALIEINGSDDDAVLAIHIESKIEIVNDRRLLDIPSTCLIMQSKFFAKNINDSKIRS